MRPLKIYKTNLLLLFILLCGVKDNNAQTFQWAKRWGGLEREAGRQVAVDASGKVYTIGVFQATADFDPGSGTVNLTAQSADGFILNLNNPSPLPIELLMFNVKAVNDKSIVCTWATATELDNDFFTIEKSRDGNEFEESGKVDGAGNSNQVIEYSFTDKNPYNGLSYYRLKQTDFNGDFCYSNMVALRFDNTADNFSLYPNPASTDLMISHRFPETFLLSIVEAWGKKFFQSKVSNHLSLIDASKFENGNYFVNVSSPSSFRNADTKNPKTTYTALNKNQHEKNTPNHLFFYSSTNGPCTKSQL